MTAFEFVVDPLPADEAEGGTERVKAEWLDATCVVCAKTFRYTAARAAGEKALLIAQFGSDRSVDVCGSYTCRARRLWSPQRWAGQARMAQARCHAQADLQRLDIDAFERTGR